MNPTEQNLWTEPLGRTGYMPVLFVGHGSPMNAIEDNEFSRTWRQIGRALPRPKAILCISAHWETWGTLVTAMEKPRTIHDFGGFPRALFEAQYPAPGSPWLAQEIKDTVTRAEVALDREWGLDHGCWSVLKQMFPDADVPVVQMSLDYTRPAQDHYLLAQELAPLRQQGVLILGSGNLVHNLRLVAIAGQGLSDLNAPFGLDWAIEANELFKDLIRENRHAELIDYPSLGQAVQLAVPTPEHYLPMLYAIALQRQDESVSYFNDTPIAGSLTMTSLIIDRAT
jgi:4,5-DOPA dioxygenase extradiol